MVMFVLKKLKGSEYMAKRRANGEGSIRKRSDGRWEGRYTVGHHPETGKQVFKNVLGKTQAEVKEKLKIAIENAGSVDVIKSEQYNVGQWFDTWYENYAKIKVRASSHQTYRGYIDNHIKPNIGKIKLEKLSNLDLQKLYKKLLDSGRVERIESKNKPKGLSVKTVRNIHQVIMSALEVAKKQRLIKYNPAEYCSLPKAERGEMRTLTTADLANLFEEAKKCNVYELYYIAIVTGARRGELLGLKWSDIDYERQIISIRRQVMRINGQVVEAPLKTKNSYRNISIGIDAVEILSAKREKSNSEYVFSSESGGAISPDSVLHKLHRVLDRAGIPRLSFHNLRHSFATLALQNGVDIKTVSSMLGHFSAGFTLDTYTHVTTQAQINAASTMGELLSTNKE